MANDQTAPLESRKDFKKDPKDQYNYWNTEMTAADKRTKVWHKQADKIVDRYVDGRTDPINGKRSNLRLNLFNSNIKTIMSMLYGNIPRVDVSRKDTTGNDDPARVAAEMMERILRNDVSNNGQTYDSIFTSTLQDRLLSGLGVARVRYAVQTAESSVTKIDGEQDGVEQIQKKEVISESAPIDYYYWGDVAWGWGRTLDELPWIAFRSFLTKDEVKERFNEHAANNVQLKKQVANSDDDSVNDPEEDSPWMKAEIWEIWDKTRRKVVWYSKGYNKILETKDDPLKLHDFYPCPPFLLANQTTKLYMPVPDYHLAQDLYNEIDTLQTRISVLTDAVKVVGVYDKNSDGIKRIFTEGMENDLIPVDNWAAFAEKGGLAGQIDWVPLADVVNALDKLRSLRDETIGLLQQVTGMADVMRGSLDNQYEGVGQTQVKAKFGSTRVQALQESFATFASALMSLKAEVISKHFDPKTIVEQSSIMMNKADQQHIEPALALIKDPKQMNMRISIKPEQLAQMDYAQLKEERAGYLNGLSTFIQAASPLIQQDPRSTPFLLEMLKWSMAGFKGSSDIEGVLDQAIEAMNQPQAQEESQKPSPEEVRGQIQIQLEKMRAESKMQEIQADQQKEMAIRQQDMQADIETDQRRMQFDMMRDAQKAAEERANMEAKMVADIQTELMTSRINAEQQQAGTAGEIEKEMVKSQNKIREIQVSKRADAGLDILKGQLAENKDRLNNADTEQREARARAETPDTTGGDDDA